MRKILVQQGLESTTASLKEYYEERYQTGRTMTPQRLQHIRQLFESVVDLAPINRSVILLDARSRDPELARELEALISAFGRRSGFLDHPAEGIRVLNPPQQPEPRLNQSAIDGYGLHELIGEGGMGQVWRAEQTLPCGGRWPSNL